MMSAFEIVMGFIIQDGVLKGVKNKEDIRGTGKASFMNSIIVSQENEEIYGNGMLAGEAILYDPDKSAEEIVADLYNPEANTLKLTQDDLIHLKIPEGVTKIADGAFEEGYRIFSVQFPESLQEIGSSAFRACVNLRSVVFPSSIRKVGLNAFNGCVMLKHVELGEGIEELGLWAFSETAIEQIHIPKSLKKWRLDKCSNLMCVTFDDDIEEMDGAIDYGCKVKSLTLPSALKPMRKLFGGYRQPIFTGNTLEKLDISHSNEFFYIENNCLIERETRKLVLGCNVLGKLVIPEGVKTIDYCAFAGRDKITEIVLPTSCTAIEDAAFKGCTALERISGGLSLQTIGAYAFQDCSNLKSIFNGPSLKAVGDFAYGWCSKLETVILDEYAKSSYVVACCENLREFTMRGNYKEFGGFDSKKLKKVIVYGNIESIRNAAFGSGYVEYLEFNGNIDRIESGAFDGCKIGTIVFNGKINFISTTAFKDCKSIEKIFAPQMLSRDFPKGAKEAVRKGFEELGLTGREETVKKKKKTLNDCVCKEKDFILEGDCLIKYQGSDACVCTPAGVKKIKERAFLNTMVEELIISEGVEVIESRAVGCDPHNYKDYLPPLKRVVLPSTLKEIGWCAFSDLKLLEKVEFNSASILRERVFEGSNKIKYTTYNGGKYLGNKKNKYLVCVKAGKDVADLLVADETKVIAPELTENVRIVRLPDKLKRIPVLRFNAKYSFAFYIGKDTEDIESPYEYARYKRVSVFIHPENPYYYVEGQNKIIDKRKE